MQNLCQRTQLIKLKARGEVGLVNNTYSVDEIFQNIENDPDNANMTIPPEICKKMGWIPGDVLKITVEDGVMSITKVTDGKG